MAEAKEHGCQREGGRLAQGQVCQILHSRAYGQKTMAFHRATQGDAPLVATGGTNQIVRIWRSYARHPWHSLPGHTDIIKTLAFSLDGRLLASGGNDQTVRVWDVERGEHRFTFHGHTGFVQTVTFRPCPTAGDGERAQQLISSGDDRTILLWALATGAIIHTLAGHTNVVTALALDPSAPGQRLLASGSWDRTIRLWDLDKGEVMGVLQGSIEILAIAFSLDGGLLAVSGFAPIIEVWEVATGELCATLRGHQDFIPSLTFQPTADTPRLVSGSHDETIKLWDITTGACIATLRAPGPYAGMQIDGAVGISAAQKSALITLGAVDALNHQA